MISLIFILKYQTKFNIYLYGIYEAMKYIIKWLFENIFIINWIDIQCYNDYDTFPDLPTILFQTLYIFLLTSTEV